MKPLAFVLLTGALAAEPPNLHETGFTAGNNGLPEAWSVWSPRPEIAPRTFLDPVHYRSRPASLAISGQRNAAERVTQFLAAIEKTVPAKPDIILLPEGITVVGTGKKSSDVAEPVPGPTTERLARVAQQRSAYIVAGVYEREGHTIYNTAVLLDRQGN